MTESEKIINSISPYINKVIDNGYLIDRSVIINELFSKRMYISGYAEYIFWMALNQRKYNKENLSIKSLITLLSIDIKSHIMIFHKNNNVYCCCDFAFSRYSRSSTKKFLFIFNIMDQTDMIILFTLDEFDRGEIIKDNILFNIIYNVLTKKLKDIEYSRMIIKPNIFSGCDIFCDNILYLLYYAYLEKHADNENTDSMRYKISQQDNSLGRVFHNLERLFKVVSKKCSYYHDTISQEDLIEYQLNNNLPLLKIEFEPTTRKTNILDGIHNIKSQSTEE